MAPANDPVVVADRTAGAPVSGGKLVYGLEAESDGFNPAENRWAWSGAVVAQAIFDPLVIYDADLHPQPNLAQSLSHNAAFDQWTITLRPGVKFHDGTAFTAAAVKAGLDQTRSAVLTGASLRDISSIAAPDELTVVVSMTRPWATFPNALSSQVGMIASPQTYADQTGRSPIGTGPFVFQSWKPDQALTVTRNPSYWQASRPRLDTIEFRPIVDQLTRERALEAGDVDVAQFTGIDRSTLSGLVAYSDTTNNPERGMIALNTSSGPFADADARRAVSLAVDRTAFAGGHSTSGYLGPGSPFTSSAANASQASDNAQAKALADAYRSRTGRSLSFTILASSGSRMQQAAQLVQAQLGAAGIKVTIDVREQATMIVDVLTGKYEAAMWVMFGGPSPENDTMFLTSSSTAPGALSLNLTRFQDPTLLSAFQAFRSTDDASEQTRQMATVQQTLASQAPWIFLYDSVRTVATSPRVHGAFAYDTPDGGPGMPTVTTFVGNVWIGP